MPSTSLKPPLHRWTPSSARTLWSTTHKPITQQGDEHHVSDSKSWSADVDELLGAYDEIAVYDA
jgi:hypothetical protein